MNSKTSSITAPEISSSRTIPSRFSLVSLWRSLQKNGLAFESTFPWALNSLSSFVTKVMSHKWSCLRSMLSRLFNSSQKAAPSEISCGSSIFQKRNLFPWNTGSFRTVKMSSYSSKKSRPDTCRKTNQSKVNFFWWKKKWGDVIVRWLEKLGWTGLERNGLN